MNREILRLAVPNIISNISVPLLSTVDTVLMGQLSGLHLGAVGIGAMIFNFLYWNFVFLRMGTTGLTAQAYGKNDEKESATVLGRAMLSALGVGIVFILLQWPFYEISSLLMNVSNDHAPLIEQYFKIRILAAPATLSLYVMMGWYFGMQNAIYPLIITIFLNLINIGCSAVMVLQFNMGVEGVAYGTLIAQYLGLILATILLFNKYSSILKNIMWKAIMIKEEILAFFDLNKDIFLRTLCLSVVFAFFYSQSSNAGEMVLASSVILLQFLNWMSYGIDGFAFAAESLTGKYFGAKNDEKLKKTIRFSLYWGAGLAILFSLTFWVFDNELISLFSHDEAVISSTKHYYIWIIIMPIVGFASYIWDGVFVGLTAAKSMRNSMFLAFAVYFIIFYTMKSPYGSVALWVALLGFLFARGLFQSILYIKYGKNLR